jgi:hypothetical protein
MIKIVAAHEMGKEHDNTQQQDQHPKKIVRRILAFNSKLSLAIIIGSMLLFDLAFILLIMR